MSTRLYPLYKANSPQLRILLPNFWMKLLNGFNDQPKNIAVVNYYIFKIFTKTKLANFESFKTLVQKT